VSEQTLEVEKTNKELQITRTTSSQLQEELELEKEKVERLEGELEATEVVKDGLHRDLEKARTFCKKVGRAVGVEQETEAILVAGDFAYDAILMKAEQLAKQEVSFCVVLFFSTRTTVLLHAIYLVCQYYLLSHNFI